MHRVGVSETHPTSTSDKKHTAKQLVELALAGHYCIRDEIDHAIRKIARLSGKSGCERIGALPDLPAYASEAEIDAWRVAQEGTLSCASHVHTFEYEAVPPDELHVRDAQDDRPLAGGVNSPSCFAEPSADDARHERYLAVAVCVTRYPRRAHPRGCLPGGGVDGDRVRHRERRELCVEQRLPPPDRGQRRAALQFEGLDFCERAGRAAQGTAGSGGMDDARPRAWRCEAAAHRLLAARHRSADPFRHGGPCHTAGGRGDSRDGHAELFPLRRHRRCAAGPDLDAADAQSPG